VARNTNGAILILTPLAVSAQTIREGEKFGIEVQRSRDGKAKRGIVVTNYERLHYFDPSQFVGVVCDESSAIKSFNGERRKAVTEFLRKVPYRLLCTATAAPNDYIELGTSSEALGQLGHMDMLGRFFKNDQGTIRPTIYRHRGLDFKRLDERAKWRFKGHAETPFWRWVCSWARAIRRPSDLGCDDAQFVLPLLEERHHVVTARRMAPGMLFPMPSVGLREQREERRRTIEERCEKVAELVAHDNSAVCWCHLNSEGDMLADLIPDAVQVSGSDSDDAKEEAFLAFSAGQIRVLVTKPKIGAWGLNWQHCAHMTTFPSHSFEQYYQSVRRCWRFGQERTVVVDVVSTEGEGDVLANLQRKAMAADRMFSNLVAIMNDPLRIARHDPFTIDTEVPAWLSASKA
jgi:hypothetical protein